MNKTHGSYVLVVISIPTKWLIYKKIEIWSWLRPPPLILRITSKPWADWIWLLQDTSISGCICVLQIKICNLHIGHEEHIITFLLIMSNEHVFWPIACHQQSCWRSRWCKICNTGRILLVHNYQYFFFTLWCSCHTIGVVMSDNNHVCWNCMGILVEGLQTGPVNTDFKRDD